MALILIVEDDENVRMLTKMNLELVGHTVLEAEDGLQARSLFAQEKPDLVILDVMLPGEDGFSLGKSFLQYDAPILFVTARTSVTDRVYGLMMGAEDYILKPFEPQELLARVENILKRRKKEADTLSEGELFIDYRARQVFVCGKEIMLTGLEFELLCMLSRRRNIAVSREELLSGVWGYQYMGETRTVDVHVQRLRAKIGAEYIETVYKYGYRFSGRKNS